MIEFIAKCGLEYDVRPGESGFVKTEPCTGKKKFTLEEKELEGENAWIGWECPKCGVYRDIVTMYKNSLLVD